MSNTMALVTDPTPAPVAPIALKKATKDASRLKPVITKDAGGDYIASLAQDCADASGGLRTVVEHVRVWMKDGKLAEPVQRAAERSMILGCVADGVKKLPAWGSKPFDARLKEALRLSGLKGFNEKAKDHDGRRTHLEEALFTTARQQKKYYLAKLGLKPVDSRGGDTRKRDESGNVISPPAKPIKVEPETFTLVQPSLRVSEALTYLETLGEGIKRTISKSNPEAFKNPVIQDVVAKILKELERLHNVKI